MKYVFRVIGFLVVVMVIAALALYTLNSFGYLKGPLSKWINDISNHCQATVNDTKDFLENQDLIPISITVRTPVPAQTQAPAVQEEPSTIETPAPAISFTEP